MNNILKVKIFLVEFQKYTIIRHRLRINRSVNIFCTLHHE